MLTLEFNDNNKKKNNSMSTNHNTDNSNSRSNIIIVIDSSSHSNNDPNNSSNRNSRSKEPGGVLNVDKEIAFRDFRDCCQSGRRGLPETPSSAMTMDFLMTLIGFGIFCDVDWF